MTSDTSVPDATDPRDSLGDLIGFLDASPSPWHAVESTIERLAGFERLDESAPWPDVPAAGYVVRDAALIAWRLPSGPTDPASPFRIVGGHTDSPCLRVKPRPDAGAFGWKQLAVEVYGGILNNSWLDRDLGVAGRLIARDGTAALVDVHEPIARVPQLAVHLDRDVNGIGLVLDTQQHLSPVWGVGFAAVGEFADWIGARAGVASPAWWELSLFDVQGASVLGADRSLLSSGRLDNQLSCWAAATALAASEPADHVAMIVLNDHEEVGSSSRSGAAGPFLEHVINRLVESRG
ncbi:MAG: M18 family aminopeptidase, partial [Ilumatobacteraceae bacterium]